MSVKVESVEYCFNEAPAVRGGKCAQAKLDKANAEMASMRPPQFAGESVGYEYYNKATLARLQ